MTHKMVLLMEKELGRLLKTFPKEFYFYWAFYYNYIIMEENPQAERICIGWMPDRKKFKIMYQASFLEANSVEENVTVLLHEILHPWFGHLALDQKKLSEKIPWLPHNQHIFNVAMDWEINMSLIHSILPMFYPDKHQELSAFLKKVGTLPPENYLDIPNPHEVFYWLSIIEKTANKVSHPLMDSHDNFGKMTEEELQGLSIGGELPKNQNDGYGIDKLLVAQKFTVESVQVKKLKIELERITCTGYGKQTFRVPHIYSLAGVIPKNIVFPSKEMGEKFSFNFFIDTSGSMSPTKLNKAYPIIKPYLQGLGKITYTMCDTEIHKFDHLRKDSLKTFVGGGSTSFKNAVWELVKKRGIRQFLFYTDGQFDPFEFPKELKKEDQIWLLVDEVKLEMPGIKIYI